MANMIHDFTIFLFIMFPFPYLTTIINSFLIIKIRMKNAFLWKKYIFFILYYFCIEMHLNLFLYTALQFCPPDEPQPYIEQ